MVTVTVEIDAAPDDVWRYLEQIERHVEWMADAESIRFVTDSTRGVGTTFVCATKIGPVRLADTMTVTAWDAPHRIGVTHTGLVGGVGEFVIEPIDLGRRTRFTWTETLTFPWWLGGSVGAAIGGRTVLTPLWRANLTRLRRHFTVSN